MLKTKSHTYHLIFGPGRTSFPDGVALAGDATFALIRDTNALMLVHGTLLDLETREGPLTIRLDKPASLSAEFVNGGIKQEISGDIQYDTFGGVDHPRPVPEVKVTFTGNLWPSARAAE